jgi:hypothetical protein
MRLLNALPAFAATWLAGCGGTRGSDPIAPDGTPPSCADGDDYPAGASEPMALGDTLFPYAWPEARSRSTGETVPLNLGDVPCDQAEDIDWSPFDVLLFVSIPAW